MPNLTALVHVAGASLYLRIGDLEMVLQGQDDRTEIERAEDALYDHLDAYGATKRITYLISTLIEARIKAALDELRKPVDEVRE